MESRNCLDLNAKMLYYFGMWQVPGEPRTRWYYARYLLPRFELFHLFYSILFQCVNIHLAWGDTEHMSEYFMMILFYIAVSSKLATLFLYREKLQDIMETLESLNKSYVVARQHNKAILLKNELLCKKMATRLMISLLVMFLGLHLALGPETFRTRVIPFRRWLPYDHANTPIFELTIFTTAILTMVDGYVELASSILLVSIAIHTVGQFKMLRHNILNIREIATGVTRETTPTQDKPIDNAVIDVDTESCAFNIPHDGNDEELTLNGENIDLSRLQRNQFSMVNDVNRKELDHFGNSTSLIEREHENLSSFKERRQINYKMERYLAKCVDHHQTLIRVVKDIQLVFKRLLGVQVVVIFSLGAGALYIGTLAEPGGMKTSLVGFSLLAAAGEFLCFCLIGDQVTEQSWLINDAAYACDWLDASRSIKRSICVIMDRAQKPMFLRAAGIPLSRATFKKVCKSAYYLHALLKKIYFGEKIIDRR